MGVDAVEQTRQELDAKTNILGIVNTVHDLLMANSNHELASLRFAGVRLFDVGVNELPLSDTDRVSLGTLFNIDEPIGVQLPDRLLSILEWFMQCVRYITMKYPPYEEGN